jgi:hypothetical protein
MVRQLIEMVPLFASIDLTAKADVGSVDQKRKFRDGRRRRSHWDRRVSSIVRSTHGYTPAEIKDAAA